MNTNKIICPCCKIQFDSFIKLKNHIMRTIGTAHKIMAYIYNFKDIKPNQLIEQYDIYKEAFLDGTEENGKLIVDKIHTEIVNKREEEKRKQKLEKELARAEKAEAEEKARLEALRDKKELKKLENAFFKRMNKEDQPKTLLEEFYQSVDIKCYNFVRDITLIKGLYNKGLTADNIRVILKYLKVTGHRNINSINYVIEDALYFNNCVNELNNPDSIPYLIKKYYNGKGLGLNAKKFLKEVDIIKQSINDRQISINIANKIIDIMIQDNSSQLIWFDNYVVKNIKKLNMDSEDPCVKYTRTKDLDETIKHLIQGRIKLTDIDTDIKNDCINILTTKLTSGDFNNCTYSEFAFVTGLPLTLDLIKFVKDNDSTRPSFFAAHNTHTKYPAYINWKQQNNI